VKTTETKNSLLTTYNLTYNVNFQQEFKLTRVQQLMILERTRGLYSRWNFIALQKVNTLQLNTVSNSSNTRTRPTCSVSEHLTPIEFFQQDLLWQSSNTNSHSCSQKVSKHTSGQSIVGLSVHLHTTTALRRIVHH
jgi:hypothetical protein